MMSVTPTWPPPSAHQYALPIHHARTPSTEHTLRRKTPHGTVFAGYDGGISTNPPHKHQLTDAPVQYENTKRTFAEHERRRWQAMPVMDSVLHQAPAQMHPFYSIPSVVQPSFPYVVGPTASGGQSGPYGPFWHDGSFVPYRPTAVRDPRFYNWPLQYDNKPLPSARYDPDPASKRDRAYSWALQQYRDLLAYIHQTRRRARPAFYPKPPKPSSTKQHHIPPATPSIWSPSGIHHHDNEYQRQAYAQSFSPIIDGRPSVTPITPLPIDNTPPSQAALALSHITKFCQEDGWQWIDGMHLGGCLAYALSNFDQALRWYNKVLNIDPGHLEATSNLAATLLALGQKREAEEHWMKVVKLAPNHFEAVEHLIGLLSNESRSREAVKIIEHVESSLKQPSRSSEASFGSSGFGSSGFAIPATENGRILALIHAKGNMLYALSDNVGAARAFEDAVLIACGRHFKDIHGLTNHILAIISQTIQAHRPDLALSKTSSQDPILLTPDQALATARFCFAPQGELPGLLHIPGGTQNIARRAVISTTSNSLLSLAKIYQDGMSNPSRAAGIKPMASGVRDILALYYLSLSLQPSPSTANNVGILLASVQQVTLLASTHPKLDVPGVVPGSGVALALQYYNYGLQLDQNHAHLYTNLGSLLKDIGQLDAAIAMYERAVKCDSKFDIALANLANAVKDKGRISDAIIYYKRAVDASPTFAEAVCGLANALNSVCSWQGRGGVVMEGGSRDRWHVDTTGMLIDARQLGASSFGWIQRVIETVGKQLSDGESWGKGILSPAGIDQLVGDIKIYDSGKLRSVLQSWVGKPWEGAKVTRLLERVIRRMGWEAYRAQAGPKCDKAMIKYQRPTVPSGLTVPSAPTVLPFHTFTCPMSAKQIRMISQRNGLRISVCSLRAQWLPKQIFSPPRPPAPYLKVGYVSSDFNNHPLAHLMQSVFGLHDSRRVKAYCYATTASDNSAHRQQIEAEAPVFHDASQWSAEKLVKHIVDDGIHILINLNGYTRGARNEIFAARPAPIQMSFMGFAGTLGAEWCDYLLADETAIPTKTLRPSRNNVTIDDVLQDDSQGEGDWIYGENIIYCRDTFFCCDHRQSAPDVEEKHMSWESEQERRWQMRQELFPQLSPDTIIYANFNQLYKICPTVFRSWLRILARVPNSVLWLLRFPDLGETNLRATAEQWAGKDVASRVIFTDVAPKQLHISRARICDLVLDTPECNAHTTAADVLWSGTPLLTLPRYEYKMASRMASSILKGALPKNPDGDKAAVDLIASSEEDYEEKAVSLGRSLRYVREAPGAGKGRLMDLRKLLFNARWTSALFDTRRWVRDLEDGYEEAWRRYVAGEGGDIWLDKIERKMDYTVVKEEKKIGPAPVVRIKQAST